MSKLTKVLNTKVAMVGAIGVVGLGVAYLVEKKVKAVAEDVGDKVGVTLDAVNPVNDNNVFAQGVNAVGAKLTGNTNFSLGGWIYNKVNGTPAEQAERKKEQSFIDSIGG